MAVNLDFANDTLPYEAAINVADLITLSDAMEAFELGPNGGAWRVRARRHREEAAAPHAAPRPATLPQASCTAWST